jgi:LacI family transcriptional regulator
MGPVERPARPLLKDVARLAEVSLTTVSIVLNGKAGANIPPGTQARVIAAANQLRYRPNEMARSLRRHRSDTIGVISDEVMTTPYAVRMIQGAQDAAWEAGLLLMLVNTGRNPVIRDRAIDIMLDRQVDAILYATMAHQVVEPLPALRGVPAVLLDSRSTDGSFPSVVPDEYEGARAAVEHLLLAGHRRIGHVTTGQLGAAASLRLDGYRDTLAAHGIAYDPTLVILGSDGDVTAGVEATARLMDRADPPTAIFCFNDRMAMGAFRALRYRALRVPIDVSVVGYDDAPEIAPWLDPPLTTVALPHYEMGEWAVRYLLDRIDAPGDDEPASPPQYRIACPLVERDSVAPPPTAA